jgi:isocitrate/isopropylmalate dehydrogenase
VARRTYKVALLGGDGVGPEVVREGRRVLEAAEERYGLDLALHDLGCGAQLYQKTGREWKEGAFEFCKEEADAILLGAVGWPGVNLPNGDIAGAGVVFGLRFGLDLYANVRPTKLYRGVPHKIGNAFQNVWKPENVDFTIIRENTEGLYAPIRGSLTRGGIEEVAIDNNVITRKGAERVIRRAFDLAKRQGTAPADGKKKVTCIDKANVLRGSQLFRRVYDEVAAKYAGIERDYAYVDAFTQWMVRNPEGYHVCVTTNMLGDIVTDLASVLQGGMGMAAGGNIGDEHAMFEPIHGSAPKHVGQDKVNPVATILSVKMMFEWLGERHDDAKLLTAAQGIETAVQATLEAGVKTYDLGGTHTCSQVGADVARRISSPEAAPAKRPAKAKAR